MAALANWAEDEEDGAEGFLDALENVFWIWDDNDYSWFQREGKGRKGKGRGKGKGGRRFFRPRNKGKGKGKRKGKSYLAEDGRWRLLGLRRHGHPKAGMNGKNMMNMDTSKEKERKEKEKEKERKVMDLKIKEKDKVMGKVKQTLWTHHILLNPQRSKQLYLRLRLPLVSLWHIHLCTWHQSRRQRVESRVWSLIFQVVHMLTNMIVDCATRLKKQAQDFSLRTHNKPSAQRNWWFTCMTRHGMCVPRSLTLWKKDMYHCWCHFHRWEALVFNLSFHHRSHSWIEQD